MNLHLTASLFAGLLAPASLVTSLAGQVQVPINPQATYLRHVQETAVVPAPAIPLTALGVAPGQWLSISTAGGYSEAGGADTTKNLIGVFSSTPTLLANSPTVVDRVPGAIVAGAAFASRPTYYGNYPTDIAADFVVTRQNWRNGTLVEVPAGAAYLFLSVHDSTYGYTLFSSNSDPNNDYFAIIGPGTPSSLPGTIEHCELRTGVGATPTASPDVKPASPFATLSVEVAQLWGESTGQVFVVGANLFATGGASPVGPLPGFHMGLDAVVVQVGVMSASPGLWSFFVPPGHAGTTVIVQGFFLTSSARNGLMSASDAHRIELQ